MKLIVATHNEGKLIEIRRILEAGLGEDAARIELVSAGSLNLPDPVETGVTFQENALLKARDVAERTGCPAIADDSGLIVDVMGNAPGILSARWAGRHGDDAANNALLLAQIADIPDVKRTARFRCAAALVVPDTSGRGADDVPAVIASDSPQAEAALADRYPIAEEIVETGDMPGRIIREARGTNGFGYDPLFEPDDQPERAVVDGEDGRLTSAELTSAEKNAISHRGKALRSLVPAVERLLH
ncbi:non-canonical purine NTP pyrophosphatase [Bifidobacterium aerophilum]|uniref:dITP/XTP pyrophosphatase n=1 Tax=Bifidobacterium aerophilum TaxID=1798155 RepID=A0A6N9Z8C3_9BIFI|nr:non-canonical purine NTP pyrophosphatase [Bifidobacterium aerophilum]NEG90363.1 non-canonical purine NTP pyrophosphatase [Bifidobacterium aerophilum]